MLTSLGRKLPTNTPKAKLELQNFGYLLIRAHHKRTGQSYIVTALPQPSHQSPCLVPMELESKTRPPVSNLQACSCRGHMRTTKDDGCLVLKSLESISHILTGRLPSRLATFFKTNLDGKGLERAGLLLVTTEHFLDWHLGVRKTSQHEHTQQANPQPLLPMKAAARRQEQRGPSSCPLSVPRRRPAAAALCGKCLDTRCHSCRVQGSLAASSAG